MGFRCRALFGIALIAALTQLLLERFRRRHRRVVTEVRHAPRAVEMRGSYATKPTEACFKTRVVAAAVSVFTLTSATFGAVSKW
jgi:hypothetical protein